MAALAKIVGAEHVSASQPDRISYSADFWPKAQIWKMGGEVERFLAVGEGRAAAVAALGEEGAPAAALGLGEAPPGIGVLATFGRITRELGDKGVPPYFLKMVGDVRAIAATAEVRPEGVRLAVEVSL